MDRYRKIQIKLEHENQDRVRRIFICKLDSQLLDNPSYTRNRINYTTSVAKNNILMYQVTQISL